MGKKEFIQTMEEFLADAENNINVEPHLDESTIEPAGFFRRAMTSAGLWTLVTAKPSKILTKSIAEFLLNLKENHYRSNIPDPTTGKATFVSLIKKAKVFELPEEGEELLSNVGLTVDEEYVRFDANRTVVWSQCSKNMRSDLEKPYNYICELFTKSVACHIGGLGQITDNKLFVVTAIVDSLSGSKFNKSTWFIQNIQGAAKDFENDSKDPVKIVRRGKRRLFRKLSYALEKLFPDRDWTRTNQYKKVSVFSDLIKADRPLVDGGLINVHVRPAVAIDRTIFYHTKIGIV